MNPSDTIDVEHLSKVYSLGKTSGSLSAIPLPRWATRLTGQQAADGGSGAVRSIRALKDVSFNVPAGTILGVIGPNGAGKTTLLKVLGRVTLPTEGRAAVRGRVATLLEVGAGFQPDLTARENIYLNAALYGVPREHVDRTFDDIIEFADLGDFVDAPVKKFSSGMYLRLAFSTTINMRPNILLADEVLAVGDIAFQERCLERLGEAGREGMTVLFVSHDMAQIARLCDRVIWLNAGEIVEDGPPEEVVAAYEKSAWTLVAGRMKKGRKGTLNTYGELLRVELLSTEGRTLGAVRLSDDIVLSIRFTVTEPGVRARCIFDVFTGGVQVFQSMYPPDGPQPIDEVGVYTGAVRIPAHFLAETVYTVNARVRLTRDDDDPTPPLEERNAITFRVYNTDGSLPQKRSGRRVPGVVSPRLKWKMGKEHDLVMAGGGRKKRTARE